MAIADCPRWWDPSWEHSDHPKQIAVNNVKQEKRFELWMEQRTQVNPAYYPGYVYHGPAGRGKTSAALYLLWLAGRKGLYTKFIEAEFLLTEIKATWNRQADRTAEEVLADYLRPEVMLLDDVAMRSTTPEEKAIYYEVIVGRQNDGKPTIITTNLDMDNPEGQRSFAEVLDGRVLDRYRGFLVSTRAWGPTLR